MLTNALLNSLSDSMQFKFIKVLNVLKIEIFSLLFSDLIILIKLSSILLLLLSSNLINEFVFVLFFKYSFTKLISFSIINKNIKYYINKYYDISIIL